jgi:hypothetical protein
MCFGTQASISTRWVGTVCRGTEKDRDPTGEILQSKSSRFWNPLYCSCSFFFLQRRCSQMDKRPPSLTTVRQNAMLLSGKYAGHASAITCSRRSRSSACWHRAVSQQVSGVYLHQHLNSVFARLMRIFLKHQLPGRLLKRVSNHGEKELVKTMATTLPNRLVECTLRSAMRLGEDIVQHRQLQYATARRVRSKLLEYNIVQDACTAGWWIGTV